MSSIFLLDMVNAKTLVGKITSQLWSDYAEDASALVCMLDWAWTRPGQARRVC